MRQEIPTLSPPAPPPLPQRMLPPLPREQVDPPEDGIDLNAVLAGWAAPLQSRVRSFRAWRLARRALLRERQCADRSNQELIQDWQVLSAHARAQRITSDQAAHRLAVLREITRRQTGLLAHPVQLVAAAALADRTAVEMATGEGKTLVTMMAAALQAAEGWPVHVITANDYLARRDLAEGRDLFRRLGLTSGVIEEGSAPADRRSVYACDIVYASSKEIAFDHLRDRIAFGDATALTMQMGSQAPIMRGLWSAIIDEADSVLIDEARTPLIISAPSADGDLTIVARQAMALSDLLSSGDYAVAPGTARPVALSSAGVARLEEIRHGIGPVWESARRARELVERALYARHVLSRDAQYILREGKVEIVDENTGRIMADRTWSDGLHQMVELKEGLEPTEDRLTLGRLTFQRFFRRYRRLSGLSGTLREARSELVEIYGMAVMPVPTHRPSQRIEGPTHVLPDARSKWRAVGEAAARHQAAGRPVLIGTRTVGGAEAAAAALEAAGLTFRVLSARQDAEEAEILAGAGQGGRVTIATNMAGRGADIRLDAAARAAGGLTVLLCERHEAGRIDRQLIGRCARQGDPGQVETFLAADDEILGKRPPFRPGLRDFDRAQARLEALHRRQRADLNRLEESLNDMTAFAGGLE